MAYGKPLTPEEGVLIRQLLAQGLGGRAIARRINRNKNAVESYLRRHNLKTARAHGRPPPPADTPLATPTSWLDQPPGRVRAARQAEGLEP